MAEIADAMKSPPPPYPLAPATRDDCKKTPGWGLVEVDHSGLPTGKKYESCLPTCKKYEELWRKTLKPTQQTEPGYSGCSSYIMHKPAGNCPRQDALNLFYQKPIPAFGTPEGFVCCVKICAGDTKLYEYPTSPLPLFSGNDQPESSGPKLGAPQYPNGKPLPSAPAPRPFTGPAPKKPR